VSIFTSSDYRIVPVIDNRLVPPPFGVPQPNIVILSEAKDLSLAFPGTHALRGGLPFGVPHPNIVILSEAKDLSLAFPGTHALRGRLPSPLRGLHCLLLPPLFGVLQPNGGG
jgi:hypothetical protein